MADVKEIVLSVLQDTLASKGGTVTLVGPERLADLGVDSMDFAVVIATLEMKTGLDPFSRSISIGNVRTVADLCAAYTGS
jgi:acyl carrier protein